MHRYCGQYFRKNFVTDGGEPIGGEMTECVVEGVPNRSGRIPEWDLGDLMGRNMKTFGL
jgi:hypothetical protein